MSLPDDIRDRANEPLIVVGLGNPGPRYYGTRHNVGFDVVERIRLARGGNAFRNAGKYDWSAVHIGAREVILVCPQLFMNLSGLAVDQVLQDFRAGIENLLVILDDMDLGLGAVRIRPSGSDGGHKGLASISEVVDSKDFARLRVGIGQPADTVDDTDFLLQRFDESELEIMSGAVDKAAEAAIFAAEHPLEEVMSQFNHNPAQRKEI